jgi:hypothetical protein
MQPVQLVHEPEHEPEHPEQLEHPVLQFCQQLPEQPDPQLPAHKLTQLLHPVQPKQFIEQSPSQDELHILLHPLEHVLVHVN